MYIFTVILLFVFDFFRFVKADQFNSFKSFIQSFSHNRDKIKVLWKESSKLISVPNKF